MIWYPKLLIELQGQLGVEPKFQHRKLTWCATAKAMIVYILFKDKIKTNSLFWLNNLFKILLSPNNKKRLFIYFIILSFILYFYKYITIINKKGFKFPLNKKKYLIFIKLNFTVGTWTQISTYEIKQVCYYGSNDRVP